MTTTESKRFTTQNFRLKSGVVMPEVTIAYRTLGTLSPGRDNAVLILHGTGGSGAGFFRPIFAGVLFGPGQLLDATKYFIIVPDNVGHGKSSKPSDGLHAHFPQYAYADMTTLQHELVFKGLGVNHLRLILGTSMGCMHSWIWGETYPDAMDALMPLACQPAQIAGRNRHEGWIRHRNDQRPRQEIARNRDLLGIQSGLAAHGEAERAQS